MDRAVYEQLEMQEATHWWFQGRRKIIYAVLDSICPPESGRLVVDLGCGAGGTLGLLPPAYSRIGFDSSPLAIAAAQRDYPNGDYRLYDPADGIPDVISTADVVLLMDVLEHVREAKAMLESLISAMKSDAHLIITVPAKMYLWTQHDVTAGHYRRYEMQGLSDLWEDLAVRRRLIRYFNTRLFPAVWIVRKFNAWLGGTFGLKGTDFATPKPFINALLARTFGGEAGQIVRSLDSNRCNRIGVSLIAVLQKI